MNSKRIPNKDFCPYCNCATIVEKDGKKECLKCKKIINIKDLKEE